MRARDIVEGEGREKNKGRRGCVLHYLFLVFFLVLSEQKRRLYDISPKLGLPLFTSYGKHAEQRYHCFAFNMLT